MPVTGKNPYAPEDVIVEVKYCGICGSDLHAWRKVSEKGSGPPKPVVSGHEISGVINKIGEKVRGLEIGDRVVCEIVTFYCGKCVNCRAGRLNICCNIPPKEQRAHYTTGGGFTKLTAWPAQHIHKLPDNISSEEAVLMEPTAGSVHALLERAKLCVGESLAILGPGPRGLIMLQVAKAIGASPVIVTGVTRDKKRLELAGNLGADVTINIEEHSLTEKVQELTWNQGLDVVMETAGSPEAIKQGLRIVRPGGKLVVSGGGIIGGIKVELDTYDLIVKEVDVLGEITHVWSSWRRAIKLVSEGKVKLKPLISRLLPLSRWREGFRLADSGGEVLRVALYPDS